MTFTKHIFIILMSFLAVHSDETTNQSAEAAPVVK